MVRYCDITNFVFLAIGLTLFFGLLFGEMLPKINYNLKLNKTDCTIIDNQAKNYTCCRVDNCLITPYYVTRNYPYCGQMTMPGKCYAEEQNYKDVDYFICEYICTNCTSFSLTISKPDLNISDNVLINCGLNTDCIAKYNSYDISSVISCWMDSNNKLFLERPDAYDARFITGCVFFGIACIIILSCLIILGFIVRRIIYRGW